MEVRVSEETFHSIICGYEALSVQYIELKKERDELRETFKDLANRHIEVLLKQARLLGENKRLKDRLEEHGDYDYE